MSTTSICAPTATSAGPGKPLCREEDRPPDERCQSLRFRRRRRRCRDGALGRFLSTDLRYVRRTIAGAHDRMMPGIYEGETVKPANRPLIGNCIPAGDKKQKFFNSTDIIEIDIVGPSIFRIRTAPMSHNPPHDACRFGKHPSPSPWPALRLRRRSQGDHRLPDRGRAIQGRAGRRRLREGARRPRSTGANSIPAPTSSRRSLRRRSTSAMSGRARSPPRRAASCRSRRSSSSA